MYRFPNPYKCNYVQQPATRVTSEKKQQQSVCSRIKLLAETKPHVIILAIAQNPLDMFVSL